MPRTLSAGVVAALTSSDTAEGFVILLKIDHVDLVTPIRVASSRTDMTSNGNVFQAFPFQVTLPAETDESPPSVSLTIDNVDRQIVAAVRSISSPATVTMSVVMESAPNTEEVGPFDFTLTGVTYDKLTVTGNLGFEGILAQPWPEGTFNPHGFPALFA